MTNPHLSKILKPSLLTTFVLLFVSPLVIFAQANTAPAAKTLTVDQLVGNYKGTAKRSAGDIAFTLELKSENGKITGRLVEPHEMQINSGEISGNKLTLKLSSATNTATLVLHPVDDKLAGDWSSGAETGTVELKKVVAPSDAEVLTGEWDAAADVQGQAFPFTLTLKVEGEKVTGSSNSQLGNSIITGGTWKDGKLAFVLDGSGGQVAMVATLTDGKLIGDYDFSGQAQGRWVATKRK